MRDYKILNFILDLIYPPTCISCNCILDTFKTTRYICEDCKNDFHFKEISGCKICGRNTENELCDICKKFKNVSFVKNYSLFNYEGLYKSFIYRFKYGLKKEYSLLMAKLMYEYILQKDLLADIDLITCVPMYKEKEKKRGFNQSELLAKELSKLLGIPYKKTLERTKNTVPQSSLTIEHRFKNLNNVFEINQNKKINLDKLNILIIDDIYTSGATIMKCSDILKANGINKIYALTFCMAHD